MSERTIEDVIRSVRPWDGRVKSIRPVSGGISNTNFRIAVDDAPHDYFVKIPGEGTELFVDRVAAIAASHQAEQLGVGPKTFDWLEHDYIEIAEFVEDRRPSTNRDFLNPNIRSAVIGIYRQFHSGDRLPLTKTVFDMIEEHKRQIEELNGHMPADFDFLDRQYRLARSALEASGIDMVPSFNDPMPGNFLIAEDDTVMLIDFEYASNNDRLYDLAIWSGEMFFDESTDREILESYVGRFTIEDHARLMIHKALADYKWSLWAMIQNKISAIPFDFYKYGAWKFMRMRSVLYDPRWPSFLGKV